MMTDSLDWVGHRTVTEASIEQFAALTGDYARAHLDHHFAKSLGFETNFAHGLLGVAWAMGMHARHYPQELREGADYRVPTAMSITFKQPVFCGDTLALQWDDGQFALCNQRDEVPCQGQIEFGVMPNGDEVELSPELEPTPFVAEPERCYYAEDMFHDGPRGYTDWQTVSESEVIAFARFCGDLNPRYFDRREGQPLAVPPLMVFCQHFSAWLQAFTAVRTPASGFPGHLSDRWELHSPVRVGDSLRTIYQCTALRPSNSQPSMGLLTITLQTMNSVGQRVMSGEIVLMMPLSASVD